MTVSLPLDIKALMTTTITWEKFQGNDGYGQPSYAPPVELTCWIEPHGVGVNDGQTVTRARNGNVMDPDIDIYFDGDDAQAQTIRLFDRFTPGGIGSEGRTLQATAVETMLGPPFDNVNPWLIIVSTQ